MRHLPLPSALFLLLSACGARQPLVDDSETSTQVTTSEATSSTSDESTGTETESDTSESGSTLIPDMELDPCGQACNIWTQEDCGPNEKCTSVACEPGGSSWDSTRCRQIQGDAELGDECQSTDGSGISGNDTCVEGHLCWKIDVDTGFGNCIPYCSGTPENPSCPEQYTCGIYNDGALPICLPMCDPLAQDCDSGAQCVPSQNGDGYVCVLYSDQGGSYGTPCEWVATCNPALLCVDASWVPEPECETASGCCTPYCDLNAPNECPGLGQACLPLLDPPPVGYEHVGVCRLP